MLCTILRKTCDVFHETEQVAKLASFTTIMRKDKTTIINNISDAM